jgi:hypothetical protein
MVGVGGAGQGLPLLPGKTLLGQSKWIPDPNLGAPFPSSSPACFSGTPPSPWEKWGPESLIPGLSPPLISLLFLCGLDKSRYLSVPPLLCQMSGRRVNSVNVLFKGPLLREGFRNCSRQTVSTTA